MASGPVCGSLGFSATICSVLFPPPGVPEARGTTNRAAIPGCPFCCLATGLGKRLGLRDYLRVSAPFPGESPPVPHHRCCGRWPPLHASSLRQMTETISYVCTFLGLFPLVVFLCPRWEQALGSGSAVALVYRRKTSECVFLFTGKFFCKPHFIHCKTNSQQRKRRAELKQQKEVRFILKVVVKRESSLVGGGCQEFLQVRPMFLALGGLRLR